MDRAARLWLDSPENFCAFSPGNTARHAAILRWMPVAALWIAALIPALAILDWQAFRALCEARAARDDAAAELTAATRNAEANAPRVKQLEALYAARRELAEGRTRTNGVTARLTEVESAAASFKDRGLVLEKVAIDKGGQSLRLSGRTDKGREALIRQLTDALAEHGLALGTDVALSSTDLGTGFTLSMEAAR
jgi:hypothetical protein